MFVAQYQKSNFCHLHPSSLIIGTLVTCRYASDDLNFFRNFSSGTFHLELFIRNFSSETIFSYLLLLHTPRTRGVRYRYTLSQGRERSRHALATLGSRGNCYAMLLTCFSVLCQLSRYLPNRSLDISIIWVLFSSFWEGLQSAICTT